MFFQMAVDIIPFLEDLARTETAGEHPDLAVQVYSTQIDLPAPGSTHGPSSTSVQYTDRSTCHGQYTRTKQYKCTVHGQIYRNPCSTHGTSSTSVQYTATQIYRAHTYLQVNSRTYIQFQYSLPKSSVYVHVHLIFVLCKELKNCGYVKVCKKPFWTIRHFSIQNIKQIFVNNFRNVSY